MKKDRGSYLAIGIAGFAMLLLLASCSKDNTTQPEPNYSIQFTEKNFVGNQYFWITASDVSPHGTDTRICINFRENYRHYLNRTHVAAHPDDAIENVELWITVQSSGDPTQVEIFGRAAAIQFIGDLSLAPQDFPEDANHETGVWRKLTNGSDYDFDPTLGFVRLIQPVPLGQALGGGFITARHDTFGIVHSALDSLSLVLMRPRNPLQTDSTWNLMFRHVYSLISRNIDPTSFHLRIRRLPEYGLPELAVTGTTGSYLQFFGFDLQNAQGGSGPDGFVDPIPSIIDYAHGEIQFLDLTPFDPSGFYDPPDAGSATVWPLATLEQTTGDTAGFRAPYLYNAAPYRYADQRTKWQFQVALN